MQDNGEIVIHTKSRGSVFTIASPYMYDANGRESTSVKYTLERLNECEWLVTVIADKEWINNEDTAFPVCIDPSMSFSSPYTTSHVEPTYHTSYNGQEGTAYYSFYMPVGNEENGRKQWMSLYVSFNEGDFLDTYDKLTAVRVGFYYQSEIDTYLVMKATDGTLVDTVSVPATEENSAGYLWFDLTKYLKDYIEAGQKFSKSVTIEYPEGETGIVQLITDNQYYNCEHSYIHQTLCPDCYANDYTYYPT